jgi:putative ABC transport system permease protein
MSALVLAAFPAMQSSRLDAQQSLVRAGRGDAATLSAHRTRRVLMVVEVALAVVLLTGAGLMVRTVQAVSAIDPGFDPRHLLTMRFDVNGESGPDFRRRLSLMYDDVLTKLRSLPGVSNVAFAHSLPIEGGRWGSVFVLGDRPTPARAELPNAAFAPVTAGFFETMRIPLHAGKLFDGTEREGAPEAVIVNEAFASHFWPGGSALGQRLKQGWPESPSPWRTIVGVVGDVKLNGVDQDTPMEVYLPMGQHPVSSASLIVRTEQSTDTLIKPVAAIMHEANPNSPLYDVRTVDQLMSAAFARRRMTMIVMGGFAGLAIVLAFVGLYGVISHGVAERTREIGVRVALGATRAQVTRLFVRQGATMTTIGLVAGCVMAFGLTGLVKQLLFEVQPNDPASVLTAVTLLAVVAIGACYLPARRAARVDPTTALRGE